MQGSAPSAEQRRVVIGMATAALLTAVAFAASERLFGSLVPSLPSMADRIAFAIRADLFVAGALGLCIAAVAQRRFLSVADIVGSAFAAPSSRITVANSVLQNTLEQVVLAVIVHLALATLLRGSELAILPVLAVLFCVGRLAFALGYSHGAAGRAFGFGLTFYPTMTALVWALLRLMS